MRTLIVLALTSLCLTAQAKQPVKHLTPTEKVFEARIATANSILSQYAQTDCRDLVNEYAVNEKLQAATADLGKAFDAMLDDKKNDKDMGYYNRVGMDFLDRVEVVVNYHKLCIEKYETDSVPSTPDPELVPRSKI